MKLRVSSLLLCGVLSLSAGCQPEEADAPALKSQTEALSDGVGSWAPTAPKANGNFTTCAAVLSGTGEVLNAYSGSVQSYDPYSNTWRVVASQCTPGACASVSLTELASRQVLAEVLYPSRSGGTSYLKIYDPATDQWTSSLAPSKRNQTVTPLDSGKVLIAGGYNYMSATLSFNGAEEYDAATDTYTFMGNMLTGRAEHTATRLYSGQVLVTGGYADSGRLASAELYDPATKTWTSAGSMSRARAQHRAIRLFSGNVMVMGGTLSTTDTSVEMYDPYNAAWFAGPALPITQPTSATLLYSGEVLVTNNAGQAAIYSPSQNAWLPAASATSANSPGASVLLQTGQVMRLNGSSATADVFSR
ncbi:kelch motif-containing protein [Vitiosangium sp. GDMCC 1.1324]|uniref:Kelch repeat-containing protein n=1 Tax=Vitiosangium sp. (strain GDMCC 1.1324) TaxID=2138576 RepID=UPI00130E010D|nr:kelch motif-containing protein [Vitiosangium sp. GDMCC 1.1324]